MDPVEFARLRAVEDAARALLERKGAVSRAALQAALSTPAPAVERFADSRFDPHRFH